MSVGELEQLERLLDSAKTTEDLKHVVVVLVDMLIETAEEDERASADAIDRRREES